ncbi:MAG: LptF/LptG family permease [Bacteroidales bacterium]|nr:LptF/LptG family permease [Bacteroidales bacterium]
MKILDIYIIKKFLGTFFYAISLLILIVIIFDISENIDEFIKKDAPLTEIIFNYYLNFIPYFINLFAYLFTFISVIFFTSKLASNTEIVAMLSGGVSYYRFLRPYLISAIILAIMSFYLGNFLIPKTNIKRREFKDKYMENLDEDKERNIHLKIGPQTYVYLENFSSTTNTGTKFSMEKFDGNKLVYKMMGDRLRWDSTGNFWSIDNYTIRKIEDIRETIHRGNRLDTTMNLKPSDLYIKKEDFEEMNFWELRDRIKEERLKGSVKAKIYEVEKQKRIAAPFATIILTLIGVTLSSRKMRGGIGMHLGLGIALTFTYILFMQITMVFATFGNLSPFLAAWIPNIIFAAVGLVLLKTAQK